MSSEEEASSRVRAAIEDHQRLVEFVSARLDEDELTARDSVEYLLDGAEIPGLDWCAMPEWARLHLSRWLPARVFRQVYAARAVLTAYEMSVRMLGEGLSRDKLMLVRAHAVIWEDHPDFDPGWRP